MFSSCAWHMLLIANYAAFRGEGCCAVDNGVIDVARARGGHRTERTMRRKCRGKSLASHSLTSDSGAGRSGGKNRCCSKVLEHCWNNVFILVTTALTTGGVKRTDVHAL